MQLAIIEDGAITKFGHHSVVFNNTSFAGEPDVEFLAHNSAKEVIETIDYDAKIEKSIYVEPYLKDGVVFGVKVEKLTMDELSEIEAKKQRELDAVNANRINSLTISMRQSRLELLNRGLLDAVESHVATLSKSAQIEWEYSVEVRRDYPLVIELGSLLGLSETDLDDFFDSAKLI